jgi:hypothetical protein
MERQAPLAATSIDVVGYDDLCPRGREFYDTAICPSHYWVLNA